MDHHRIAFELDLAELADYEKLASEVRFDPAVLGQHLFGPQPMAEVVIGDSAMTLRAAFTRGWWPALRMLLLMLAGFVPLQVLHLLNHRLAMGQPAALLWALLAWDALVVGMMTGWTGTALHHGYRGAAPFAKQ